MKKYLITVNIEVETPLSRDDISEAAVEYLNMEFYHIADEL